MSGLHFGTNGSKFVVCPPNPGGKHVKKLVTREIQAEITEEAWARALALGQTLEETARSTIGRLPLGKMSSPPKVTSSPKGERHILSL